MRTTQHVSTAQIGKYTFNNIKSIVSPIFRLFHSQTFDKGRRQNSSVASGDFLQRMTNVGWQSFATQLHPYHMLG